MYHSITSAITFVEFSVASEVIEEGCNIIVFAARRASRKIMKVTVAKPNCGIIDQDDGSIIILTTSIVATVLLFLSVLYSAQASRHFFCGSIWGKAGKS